jgi:hypothetical protein
MRMSVPLMLLLLPTATLADEGMWTPDNFPAEKVEKAYGVKIDQAWLDRTRLATVRLTGTGGCTGAFVSSQGLILTNRHCAEACLAEHTTEETDIWQNGFYANHPGAEIPCSNMQADFLEGIEDVTATVNDATAGLEEIAANVARKQTWTRLEKDCETASQGTLKCEIVSLYHGGQYFLYKTRRYEDIRLVFAPDGDIGTFGGDPDNFSFPRWTLDVAFLRAYDQGQAIQPQSFLRWRPEGPDAGEPVFATGHPGRTQRQLTVAQYEFLRSVVLPGWLMRYVELRGRYRQFALEDEEAQRIVQQDLQQLENSVKVVRNELQALLDPRLLAAKLTGQAELKEAVASDAELASRIYAWHQIQQALDSYRSFYDPYILVERRGGFQGELMADARELVRAAVEREKPNAERLRTYTDSALPRVEQRVLSPAPIHMRLEQLKITFGLEKLREILGQDNPIVRKTLGNESPESMAARLVRDTTLNNVAERKKLWDGGLPAIERSKDPIIRMMRALDGDARELLARYQDEYEAPLSQAEESIAAARFRILGTSVYPDATFTLRITYGSVRGWEENGREVPPFTHLEGAYTRATGEEPYALSETWLKARALLDMDTPVNYVATLDLTGGNSGSPVIDARGNIVGLAFDGNRHAIAGDYWYDIENNRGIAVHPAVIMEALEKVYGADRITGELEDAARAP